MYQNLLKKIKNQWFYTEPLLFSALCTHTIIENNNLNIPMRSGKLRIEYSPTLLEKLTEEQIEEYLKIEILRILLLHPYQRQPYNARKGVLLLASDVAIYQFYKPKFDIELAGVNYLKFHGYRMVTLKYPLGEKWDNTDELKFFQKNLQIDRQNGSLKLIDKLTYEQWYKKILFLIKETSFSGSETVGQGINVQANDSDFDDAAELWEESENASEQIQQQVKNAEIDEGWGGIGGIAKRDIKDSCDFSFDYRKSLTQFRQSIVSASRKLTRMRPSRRYGFNAMGSRYERKANVLIAVDVSGSITDDNFDHFYHAIKNFFFLGIIEKIDLIFFDVNLKNTKPIPFSKQISIKEILGRGGTSFQPAIDFYTINQKEYSGLIIFTDGEGDIPIMSAGVKNILWILDSRMSYEKSKQWINSLSGNKATYLPF